ncbi:MAG: flippase [Candidatus Binatia bacterium]|nr:flippase [Candidatus Binatia bacterium]
MSRQLLRNSFSGLSGMTLQKIAHLATMIVLARMLGAEQFGIYAFVGAVMFFLGFLSDLGMERVLTRELAARPHDAPVLLGTALWLRLGLGLVAASVSFVLGWAFRWDRTTFVCLSLAAAALPFGFDLLARAYFQSRLQVRTYYAISVLGSVSFLILVLCCWRWKPSVTAVFIVGLANALLFALIFLLAVRSYVRISPVLVVEHARLLLREASQVGLLALLFMTALRIDQIFLFHLRGAQDVGEYAAAVRLTEALGMFSEAMMLSLFPLLAASHRSNPRVFRHRYLTGFRYLAAAGVSLALAISLIAPEALRLIFGETYEAAWPAAVLLSWNMVLAFLGSVYVNVFLIHGWYRLLLVVSAVSVAVNIVLNLLWIPPYGGVGAAAATFISSLVGFALWFAFSATRNIVVDCLRSSAPAVAAGALAGAVGVFLLGWGGPAVALSSLGLYGAMLFWLGGIVKDDFRWVYSRS